MSQGKAIRVPYQEEGPHQEPDHAWHPDLGLLALRTGRSHLAVVFRPHIPNQVRLLGTMDHGFTKTQTKGERAGGYGRQNSGSFPEVVGYI